MRQRDFESTTRHIWWREVTHYEAIIPCFQDFSNLVSNTLGTHFGLLVICRNLCKKLEWVLSRSSISGYLR
jgi:hypothetical protein